MSKRAKISNVGAYVRALRAGSTRAQAREAQAPAAIRQRLDAIRPWRSSFKASPRMPAPKFETVRIHVDATYYAALRECGYSHIDSLGLSTRKADPGK